MKTEEKSALEPRWIAALAGIILLALVSVFLFLRWRSPGLVPGPLTPTPSDGTSQPAITPTGEPYSMDIRLSEGKPGAPTIEVRPVATGERLSEDEIAQILARLPALAPLPEEQVEFKLPEELLPPPRPGIVIPEAFPPVETGTGPSSATEAGPLQVLRYAPQGEIPIAPFISVTFNQPMVPLGTLADLAALDVPVTIEPSLPGTWRWLGTKTLTFEYDSEQIDRLPKATEYRVTVPAGVKSAAGKTLAEAVTWTFRTPPPVAVLTYPYDTPQPLEPVFFIQFDQRIEPAAVLETIRVSADGQPVSVILATPADLEKDETVARLVKDAPEGRWLAFRATKPLPFDTGISVSIGPGTPSAEGPLVTASTQTYSFRTYAPLRIEETRCGWYANDCPPLSPFYIRFNNPLDENVFNENMIQVTPEIPGLSLDIYGNTLSISGETAGRTTYTVTIGADVQDIFGQRLGQDEKRTFKVGRVEPLLIGPGSNFITLDPTSTEPVFNVYAINYNELKVRIYSVQPGDWADFKAYLREWQRSDKTPPMPGRLVYDKSLRLNLPNDTLTEVGIDLSPYTTDGFGQFIVVVEPPRSLFETEDKKWQRLSQTIHTWVQVTQIGLNAYNDHSNMLVWATDLKTGAPLAGVIIRESGGRTIRTEADGTARFAIPDGATYLTAEHGTDLAFLPRFTSFWSDSTWQSYTPADTLKWYVLDDRKMYRPGEEVHIKGWLRRIGSTQNGDVGLANVASISYQISDSQGNPIGSGTAQVNVFGGFDFAFSLPERINLGNAYILLNAMLPGVQDWQYTHQIQVQEFRTPEFEVKARNETTGPYFAGESAIVAVEAKYYAGGALPNAETTWQITSTPTNYSPPNWPDFTFGSWTPWWWFYRQAGQENSISQTFSGKTDAAGEHYLRLDFEAQGNPTIQPRPFSINAEASVMDVNRQAWASTTGLLVHPADLYVGLRSATYFVEKGTPLKIEFIVTDVDGNAIAGRTVEISAARLEWKHQKGTWEEIEVDKQTCTALSTLEPGACTFETPVGGSYRITAQVSDEQGRRNETRLTRWVSGGKRPPSRQLEQEDVTLIPDKEDYQPGDEAKILVQSPFSPAEGLLTVTRNGILYTQRFQLKDGTATLTIPIKSEHIPNLNIQVDLTGSAKRTNDRREEMESIPNRPAYARGTLTLNIPPLERTLSLEVKPEQDKLEPGGETSLSIALKDADGHPVPNAEMVVVVVDEAILALTNYQLTDPISIFYSARPSMLESTYSRDSLILADPQALAQQVAERNAGKGQPFDLLAPMAAVPAPYATMTVESAVQEAAAETEAGADQTSIAIRSNFNPLAVFAPEVRTDASGRARVPIKLPDNLTRYRIMVVAVDSSGNKFGSGESNLTARLPLMVRPSAPRFLNFGDRFELPIVLQNQTDSDLEVQVALRASNLELGNAGLRVTVPANDRVEVRFPASTQQAGTVRAQVAAVSGAYADAATLQLPVYTPATTEAFATYGVVDEGTIAQPVMKPGGVFPQYGGLEVSTSSTALQTLSDAVLYLQNYPFECSEQLASRILSVAALRDVLTAFQAEGLPSPAEMESSVRRDLDRLQSMQNYDGGFPYWRRGFESIPFNTIHVTHALVRAGQKGFDVPPTMQANAMNYLRDIENRYPYWYSLETRRTLSAYALYVRHLSGERDPAKASDLIREAGLENLSMEAIGWLWPVIEDESQLQEIRRFVSNRVVETAGAANFTTYYSDQTYLLLSSDRRTDAILLDALMEDQPQSDLILKVVNGLLAHRTQGRWGNTQENVFVLLAMDRYFNTYEKQTPDFVARLWLGETYAGSSEFRGRTTETYEISIPMNYVLTETGSSGTSDLILSKDGPGRLYYRLGLRYAPSDLKLDPLEMGFVVTRRYEAVDHPDDVKQDADGTWHIKAGARVRVRLSMVADNRRYHVALVDPLPAGLEIVNPALAVSGSIPQDPNDTTLRYGWWWWGPWYEHQNLRDERAEAFTPLLWDGVYNYSYIARATTPGRFVVPPAKAEEMYSPEVFGRSGSDIVIVE